MPIFKISTVTKWYGSHVHFWGEHQNMNLETWNFTEGCVCWWRVAVQHATSTHTPQDRHLATPRTPYAAFVKEIITSIAPEDGRISPKHVELK